MKKLLLFFLTTLLYVSSLAQEDPIEVKIKSPRMSELIDKLWADLTTDCTVPSTATVEGEPTCAGLAMRHLRSIINRCTISDGFKEAIKFEFSILKLLPVGKVAGLVLDVADLTAKTLTAESPEALEHELVQFGFGRVVGEQMIGKLKDMLPEGETTEVLGNLTKLFYEKLWDKAREAILPKEEEYRCQPETEACKDNIHVTITPSAGNDPKLMGNVVFSANGDCQCRINCGNSPEPRLKTWSIHGTMELRIQSATVVEVSSYVFWKKKVLEITLVAGRPSYTVIADCACSDYQTSNTGLDGDTPSDFFVGLGLSNEDAYERFNLYGVNVAYTHPLSSQIGATGDAALYFGKQMDNNYRKLQLMAGASLLTKNQEGKLSFMPHVLVGITNIHSKYSMGNNSSSSSNTSLSGLIGTDIMMNIRQRRVGLKLGYNPVFGSGGASHNFRVSAGIVL